MSSDPDLTPSANGHYPRFDRALAPDLGELHPRTREQIHALTNFNGRRHDPAYDGPRIRPVAAINCTPRLHRRGESATIATVVEIGDELYFLASVPDRRMDVPPVEDRSPDFEPIAHVQWIWGLTWPEVDELHGYCPRHHDITLALDRRKILGEIARSAPPRPGDFLHVQLARVAVTSHRVT